LASSFIIWVRQGFPHDTTAFQRFVGIVLGHVVGKLLVGEKTASVTYNMLVLAVEPQEVVPG
jgi:hypothetical protein